MAENGAVRGKADYCAPPNLDFFRSLAPEDVAFTIGISAGTFLAIATADILPQVHRIEQRNPATLVFLLFGLSVSWLGKLIAS